MITFENVKKRYGDYIFDIQSMNIQQGMITGLIGKNGAGKSTAISLILGLVNPDSGCVKTFGVEAGKLSAEDKKRIGVLLDDSGFCSQLSVNDIEHILAKMYPRFNKDFFERKCLEYRFPMKKKIAEFSSGMKVRLKILISITHNAELLILDEPTAGLDVQARNDVLDILREYMAEDENRSIIITSHISSDIENLCDDVYLINDGRIILHEDTDTIVEQYGIVKVKEEQYEKLDKNYILKTKKECYGYACFVSSKAFYKENYPDIIDVAKMRYMWAHFYVLDKMMLSANGVDKEIENKIISGLKKNYKFIIKDPRFNKSRKIAMTLLMINRKLYKMCVVMNKKEYVD